MARKLTAAYRSFGVAGQRLLLAVSGGADSTALLLATVQISSALKLRIGVASLDHQLRAESALELERVETLASRLGVPFYSRALKVGAGPGMEARARQARYQALEEIRAQAGFDWIATAHTASDQAETLLMRLIRGVSLRGAAGIRPMRGRILRPLLACTRREVERFLSEQGVEFISDPMNRDERFTRNRIRARLIPALDVVGGPEAVRHLAEFAATAAEDDALLDELASAAYDRLLHRPARLDASGVRALVPALRRRVLARLLLEAGARVDRRTVDRAMAALTSTGRATLSGSFELRSSSGMVRCVRAIPAQLEAAPLLLNGGWMADQASGIRICLSDVRPKALAGEWLEIGEARLPLSVRHRQPGDRVSIASGRGRAKLQDLMVDLRIPAEDRDAIPVVCDAGGRILWVVGIWPRTQRLEKGGSTRRGTWYLLSERISGSASADIPHSL